MLPLNHSILTVVTSPDSETLGLPFNRPSDTITLSTFCSLCNWYYSIIFKQVFKYLSNGLKVSVELIGVNKAIMHGNGNVLGVPIMKLISIKQI